MWHIKNPKIKKTTLDFTGSGQGKPEVSQLVYEDVVLMNAIEYADFNDDAVQVSVCEHCGFTQCSPGNWLCFRKSGNYILLVPYFKGMVQDEYSDFEFAPPRYYERGTPYFNLETYEKLRASFSTFPTIDKLENLKMSEAMILAQENFPIEAFDEPPKIYFDQAKRDLIVGASTGEIDEHLQRIEQILKSNYKNNSSALIRKPLKNEEIIELFLYAYEFIEWQALVKNDEKYFLMLKENFIIEPLNLNQ